MSRRSPGSFRAHLQGIGLRDLVVLQNLVRTTGVFVVLSGDRSGSLHFLRGHLFHAETGELRGDEAALAILSWRDGEFINAERTSVETPTVTSSLEALLARPAVSPEAVMYSDESRSESSLTTSTGIRRRLARRAAAPNASDGPQSAASTTAPSSSRGLAAAATPGTAALMPRFATRAGEGPGVTNVLVSPLGVLLDGNGADAEALASRVAYIARLTELIGQAMGSGEPRSVKVRDTGSELLVRLHTDGHVSGSLGPPDAVMETPAPSLPPQLAAFPSPPPLPQVVLPPTPRGPRRI
jgi:hypothetical protein